MTDIQYVQEPAIETAEFNALFARSWPSHQDRDFPAIHAHSLAYVCAFAGSQLVGYVNVATDGAAHAFLLDPTVDPAFRRRGIGTQLMLRATNAAREARADWLHVDYEPGLEPFYSAAGFRSSLAGLIPLRPIESPPSNAEL